MFIPAFIKKIYQLVLKLSVWTDTRTWCEFVSS